MKKIFVLVVLFFSMHLAFGQTLNNDYVLFDKFLSTIPNQSNLVIIEKSADFIKQETFFSKDFLHSYTEPTIGVDSKKVKKLIKQIDFDYLKQQKRQSVNWDFTKSKIAVIKYTSDGTNQSYTNKIFEISVPVYSQNASMAFIFFREFCGIDCGSSGVKIFKKCKKGWELYLTIPLTIS